jgi:hypothetical protein
VQFKRFALTALLLLMLVSSPRSFSQDAPPVPPRPKPVFPEDEHQDQARVKIEKEMARRANQERQAQLMRDTNNLLKLATELKQSVEKSNENTLSVDVVKKAEEIEKLAHSVKEKMKAN